MRRVPTKTKLIAAAIGVFIAIVLTVGGTFAWLILSRKAEVKNMKVNVTNTTILEIAQAYPENYLTGPPEVGEDDVHKTRTVGGQTVADQGVWGKLVDMTGTQIILQEPATVDGATLSTVKYDRTGRTNGFQPLVKQPIDEQGLVYYVREVTSGNYRGEDGHIYTATSSTASQTGSSALTLASSSDGSAEPIKVKCAGGVSLWMRSNKPTSEEVLLKGLKILKKDSSGQIADTTDDDILGVVVNTYHLEKTAEAKEKEKNDHKLQPGTLIPFNNYYAQKTDDGYVCTLFAGSSQQQMQPGELYLVEIICYIEGDRENGMGNIAAVSNNTGTSKQIAFEEIDCQDVLYAAKVTEENGTTRKSGWYSGPAKLKIELFGSAEKVDKKNIIIKYELVDLEDPTRELPEGTFKAFNDQGTRNSVVFDVYDGEYSLTVMTAQTDESGAIIQSAIKYYTVNIGDTSMVNTVEDSILVQVDTIDPIVNATLSTAAYGKCGCTYAEADGTSYHNHDVMVLADVTEKNLSQIKIGGRQVAPATVSESAHVYRSERLYSKEGTYTPEVEASDISGRSQKKELKFIIDKTEPEVTEIKWGFIKDDSAAIILNRITGGAFFEKAVRLHVEAEDEHVRDISLADKNGTLNAKVVKDSGGELVTAEYDLPKDYHDEIMITVDDKAGNIHKQSTGIIYISDKVPDASETHEGDKAGTDEYNDTVWYDITYHLTASGSNAEYVTGYEFSPNNGTDSWYSTDQNIGDVYYKVGKTNVDGDTVTIYCKDYTSVAGSIYFRPVTSIISNLDSSTPQYVRGNVLQRDYKLKAIEPTVPTVQAKVGDSVYTSGVTSLPPARSVIYTLSGGDMIKLDVDHYEYSFDAGTDDTYPKAGKTEWTKDGITYKVSGSRQEVLEVTCSDGEEKKANIYFRTVSIKQSDASVSVHGPWTAMHSLEIDRKAPEVSSAEWSYVNDGSSAGIISTLTGSLFFNKKIKVQIKAADTNIDDVTCDGFAVDNDKSVAKEITATVYAEPDFQGKLTFTALDKAGNTSSSTTSRLVGTDVNVTETLFTYNQGHQACRYVITIPEDSDITSAKYEYNADGSDNWYEYAMGDNNYHYFFDAEPTSPDTATHREFVVYATKTATPDGVEPPAKVKFRVTISSDATPSQNGSIKSLLETGEYKFQRK